MELTCSKGVKSEMACEKTDLASPGTLVSPRHRTGHRSAAHVARGTSGRANHSSQNENHGHVERGGAACRAACRCERAPPRPWAEQRLHPSAEPYTRIAHVIDVGPGTLAILRAPSPPVAPPRDDPATTPPWCRAIRRPRRSPRHRSQRIAHRRSKVSVAVREGAFWCSTKRDGACNMTAAFVSVHLLGDDVVDDR